MSVVQQFTCQVCGERFEVASDILARYPGWKPRKCLKCGKKRNAPAKSTSTLVQPPPDDPQTGVFTDGFCEPNPGRGGWGVVKVIDSQVVKELWGSEEYTTNNRMELRALIEGLRLLDDQEELTAFSDSQYCVNTATKWAADWKRKGWKRNGNEAVSNLDLVQELYEMALSRPNADIKWIRGHAGHRWNEYADRLSSRFLEEHVPRA